MLRRGLAALVVVVLSLFLETRTFGSVAASAPSGATVSGSYNLTPLNGTTITWSATGVGATDVGGLANVPTYWIQVYDLTTSQVLGQSVSGLLYPPNDNTYGYHSGTISFTAPQNEHIEISEGASILRNDGGGTYEFIEDHETTWKYYVGGDPALSEFGSYGGTHAINYGNTVAEPVDVVSGAFVENDVDLHINGPLPIEVSRSYTSTNASAMNEFGYGWIGGYSSYLIVASDNSTIQAANPDGSVVSYRQSSGSWAPTVADNPGLANSDGGVLNPFGAVITQPSSGIYQLKLANGTVRNYTVQQFPITSGGTAYTRQRPYLTSVADNRGNTLTFTYGATNGATDYGRINHVQSSNGTWISFTYDAEGRILSAYSSDTRSVLYAYNYFGDLSQVTLPDGSLVSYSYGLDSNGASTHVVGNVQKPNGQFVSMNVDSQGRVTRQFAPVDQSNPGAPVLTNTFDYSVAGQTTVKDAYQNPTVYQYNASGQVTKITDPLSQTIVQSWYAGTGGGAYPGSLQSVTDKRGLVTTYTYDSQGNTTQTQILGNLTGDPTASETATKTVTYNSSNMPLTVVDPAGITTTYSYTDSTYTYLPTQVQTSKGGTILRTDTYSYTSQTDSSGTSKGLLASQTVAYGTGDAAQTDFVYNSAGFPTQKTYHTGTADPNVVVTYTYNTIGQIQTETDAAGRSKNYTYDLMGRQLSETIKNESGVSLGTSTATYNGNGQLLNTSGFRSSPADLVQRTYDSNGRLEEEVVSRSQAQTGSPGIVAASAAVISYGHDLAGNLVLQVDPLGNPTTMTYDANGQMLTRNTAGLESQGFQYEPGGKVSQYTSPLGGVTKDYYTSTGQLRRVENPDGSVLQWTFYTDGRLQKEILRNGAYWTTTYDDIARTATRVLTTSGGAFLESETKGYNLRGDQVSFTDPDGYVKTSSFDGLGRVKTTTGPSSISSSAQQIITEFYSSSNQVLTTLNGDNEQTVTTSDAMDRPQRAEVFNSGGTSIRLSTYSYSADNNAVVQTEGSGASAVTRTTWTDTYGNVVCVSLGDGATNRMVYDSGGNITSSVDSLSQTTTYSYNTLNQRTGRVLPDGSSTTYAYDVDGNLLTRSMANGTLLFQQTFDSAGRKLTESLTSGSTVTRQFSYSYYSAGSSSVGFLQSVTAPRATTTTVYDNYLRPQTITTSGSQAEVNGTTTFGYNLRGGVTDIAQSSVGSAAGPTTLVHRSYDGNGQITAETVSAGGATYANIVQNWDGAGRRTSLNDSSSSLGGSLFTWTHRADGLIASVVTPGAQTFAFSYANNGLLTGRSNPFRSVSIDSRDAAGRVLQQTSNVGTSAAMVENLSWRSDGTASSYAASRVGTGTWNDARAFSYNSRGQITSETFAPAATLSSVLNYAFDGSGQALGVRLDAKIGSGAPASWEISSTPNSLGQVMSDTQANSVGGIVQAAGTATGADHVSISIDGVSQGHATYTSGSSSWTMNLDLAAGSHTLLANAVDTSGAFSSTATSTFTVTHSNPGNLAGTATTTYDGDGNVSTRTWSSGVVQSFTWDAFNRLVKVSQRDSGNNGYDWIAVYDALGRRVYSSQQPVSANVATGAATTISSIYDPQIEFLEIGVSVNGTKAWKVYGPDIDGIFGSFQGTGGLEATILDSGGTAKGLLADFFGNGEASITGTSVSWFSTHVGAYGPLPDSVSAQPLGDVSVLAEATIWREHRIDPTGLYYMGARYYEPVSGRFVSPDPLGYSASPSLYDFCAGDPVNRFDPDGRCPTTPHARYADNSENSAYPPNVFQAVGNGLYGATVGAVTASYHSGVNHMASAIIAGQEGDWALATLHGVSAVGNATGLALIGTGAGGSSAAAESSAVEASAAIAESGAASESTAAAARTAEVESKAIAESTAAEQSSAAAQSTATAESTAAAENEAAPIWSATKDLSAEENAAAHAAKHGAEFPELAEGEYVEAAQKFVSDPPPGALTKVRPNGDMLIYDPATNTFGVRAANGAPRTMFRPTDGSNYWKRQ